MENPARKSELKLNMEVGIGNGKRKPIPLGNYEGIFRKDVKAGHEYYALVRVKHEKHMRVDLKKIIQKLHLEKLTPTLLLIPLEMAKVCDGQKRLGKTTDRKGIG